MAENSYWQYDTGYWINKLNSSPNGLSQDKAQQLLPKAQARKLTGASFRKDVWLFISQFKSPLMLLLLGAILISSFLGDISDVFIILFIVLSSGLLSFIQERNAGKVVEKLQHLIAIRATALRNGAPHEIPMDQIVPGDVILLRAGDMLPADCLLLEANELHANESSLTGESYPVHKTVGVVEAATPLPKRTNCLWQGSNIVSGSAKALVIQTGAQTVFGNIASNAGEVIETAFEKGIKDFGFLLMKITLVLAAFILVVNLLNHKNVIESALFALALAVGMAPELLPAITTISMSAGAKKLLEKKVIVKKLNSIQNLGEVNLLCTDKTGTITEGAIRVARIVDGEGRESDWAKQLAWWNASLETGYTNPIDEALKQLKVEPGFTVQKTGEVPYDFMRKRLSIGVALPNQNLLVTKGAFTAIAGICTKLRLSTGEETAIEPYRTRLENAIAQNAMDGFRTIALAYKKVDTAAIARELETDMVFAGFILLSDPVKTGMAETIAELNKLQVSLKIITGDNQNIARITGTKIGIQNPVILTGAEIGNASPEALQQLVTAAHIFAEVDPQQKEQIILALKKTYTVAYMGDGINDVAAINAADIGISVDNAVDVAREAADFVLMEKNLMVLVEGIKEGRKTFANTLKYLYISTGSTFGNMCSVAAASLALPFLPMLPKQILLTNFLTDFPFLMVTTDNVDEEQINKPGKWKMKVIRDYMLVFGIHSSLFDLITFLTLYYFLKVGESAFQTGWFIESVLSELVILFIIRTHKNFFRSSPGKYLTIFSGIALALTVALPYLPWAAQIGLQSLSLFRLALILGIVAAYILTADLLKVWFFKRHNST